MSDKISALTSVAPTFDDTLVIVDDIGGTPLSKRINLTGVQTLFRQDFDTRAAANSATIDATASFIRTAGYSTLGDGGGATYVRVGGEPSHDFKVQSADGAWWEGVVENGQINPRAIGGTSDEVSAEKAFDYVISEGPSYFTVVFSGLWTLLNTCTVSDPQDIHVDARAAEFTTPNDILMFDLNGRADPTYVDNSSRQNFHWIGGVFRCTFSTPTKATAFRMMGFRFASLKPDHFYGWYRDIMVAGKDTIHISDYKTFDNEYASIEIPPWSTIGGPLSFRIQNIHGSLSFGTGTKLINSYTKLGDSIIRDFSCNLGDSADIDGAIDIHVDVLLGLSAQSGSFIDGETVTGGGSGATCTFRELYTHDFAFDVSQNLVWLVGEDRSATLFVTGDALTAPSGATGTVGAHAGYMSQNENWKNFHIAGANHFEAGSGANGAIGIRLRDRQNQNATETNIRIDAGSMSVSGGGAIGIELQNLTLVEIKGYFPITSANGTAIKLNSGCLDIKITKPSFFFDGGVIDLNGMARSELNLSDWDIEFSQVASITDWGPMALSNVGTNSDTKIDMSAKLSSFERVGDKAPVAYVLGVQANDSASAASSTARFRMYHPDDGSAKKFSLLNVAGLPDDREAGATFYVGCDGSGDIEYDATASGAGTLDVNLVVHKMIF